MELFSNFFSSLSSSVSLFDILIVCIFLFYAYEGYALGVILASVDLTSFILSFTLALKTYTIVADWLMHFFGLPLGLANALGFFLVAFVSEISINILLRKGIRYIPTVNPARPIARGFARVNHLLGILPGFASAFIILSFLLSIIVALPSSPMIKQLVTHSALGSHLVANTSLFEKRLNDIFGGAFSETLNFLTIEPESNEMVKLQFQVTDGIVDPEGEQAMFRAVNTERQRAGLHLLSFDDSLRDVARAHSQDMLERGYFSHYTPDGISPFDRMSAAGIEFLNAGENLALAPTTPLAMQGLMNSPGHRANILNPNFNKIGIGVIDGGMYGKMYSQEFTN
ncbi:MAG: CvpA family protein [Patescibacteria group bacterium]